jgi:arylformamidase
MNMKLTAEIGDVLYDVSLNAGTDISIPVNFDGNQPNLYGVPPATAVPYKNDFFNGNTAEGGSCNVAAVRIIPHCNGTHTECMGHLTHEKMAIIDVLKPGLVPCVVMSVSPVGAADTAETALDGLSPENLVVTRQEVEKHLRRVSAEFRQCVVVRTFPNHQSKRFEHYGDHGAAFFSRAAIQAMLDYGVQHLVTDLPSIDPLDDGGIMMAHRLFWGIRENSHEQTERSDIRRTITELVYIPDSVVDGQYVIDLQIAPLRSDASPSRPVLYPVEMI